MKKSLELYYHASNEALMLSISEGDDIIVGPSYIKSKCLIREVDGNNWELQIEFEDLNGNLKTIEIPRRVLVNQRDITEFWHLQDISSFAQKPSINIYEHKLLGRD